MPIVLVDGSSLPSRADRAANAPSNPLNGDDVGEDVLSSVTI